MWWFSGDTNLVSCSFYWVFFFFFFSAPPTTSSGFFFFSTRLLLWELGDYCSLTFVHQSNLISRNHTTNCNLPWPSSSANWILNHLSKTCLPLWRERLLAVHMEWVFGGSNMNDLNWCWAVEGAPLLLVCFSRVSVINDQFDNSIEPFFLSDKHHNVFRVCTAYNG